MKHATLHAPLAGTRKFFREYREETCHTTSRGAARAASGQERPIAHQESLVVIEPGQYEQLQRAVFASGSQRVFAVLDGAIIDGLPALLQRHAPKAMCLFSGDLDPMLAAAAPYLVELQPGSAAAEMVLRDGWNAHWGIVLQVDEGTNASALRSHLRRVLRVATPDGRAMLFRFFDPRAFRTVIPTLDADQQKQFFGPIKGCYTEGRSASSALYFRRENATQPRQITLGLAA